MPVQYNKNVKELVDKARNRYCMGKYITLKYAQSFLGDLQYAYSI